MGKNNLSNMRRPLFGGLNSAAEFVTPGHPDKTCDQIAGKILDTALKINPKARVAIEMVACNGRVVIGGELSDDVYEFFKSNDDFEEIKRIARSVFEKLGYISNTNEFQVNVEVIINKQSEHISNGDGKNGTHATDRKEIGAGDQGVMCGYAIYAPEYNYMPAAFWYSQQLAIRLFDVAMNGIIPGLFADGKTQVVIKEGLIKQVTIAIQHATYWSELQHTLKNDLITHVIQPIVGSMDGVKLIVNGTGIFEKGSIWADAGEVGRKIVIDQMGPDIPVGGGSLNGKDPSKVDLTGAVMARYIAKNIVANELADEAFVQFAFTIGQLEPDQINIYAPGWKLNIDPIEWCKKHFKLTVSGMVEELSLNRPQDCLFENAAKHGFYGHGHFPWEKIKAGLKIGQDSMHAL